MNAPEPRATAGYLTDVEYTGLYFEQLAPARLAYIAALNGYAAPRLDQPFTWCELGCGKALSPLVLAALHPHGEFHAFDLNAAHIEYAERLRVAAGIRNLRLQAASVGDMLRDEAPRFDFVVLHGVYSWVPEAVREEIRAFLRKRLKPGGLAMLSYNAMPGWAHLQPVREMLRAAAAAEQGDSQARARAAYRYVAALAEGGAAYFKALPAAAEHVRRIAAQDIRYVAHEYLTPHGDPFYFAEVEQAMRHAGLAFAGSMQPADNYPALMIPERFQALLPRDASRAALETHRDFVLNTAFRSDLYAAQPERPRRELQAADLAGLAFALTDLPERLPLERKAGALTFDLNAKAAAVRAVHAALGAGPLPAAQAASAAGPEGVFLLEQRVVAGHLAPCADTRVSPGWPALNSAMVEAALREQHERVPLACPATTSANYSEPVHAAALEAALAAPDAAAAGAALRARLRGHAHPVNRHDAGGAALPASDAEIERYAAETWRGLRDPANRQARLLRLFGLLA